MINLKISKTKTKEIDSEVELLKKYNVGISESDNYNSIEEYCWTTIYLTINELVYYKDDLNDFIKNIINKKPWKK